VYGTTSSAVSSSWDQASARNVADPGTSLGWRISTGSTGATLVFASASAPNAANNAAPTAASSAG
jgi:hypothetical protein